MTNKDDRRKRVQASFDKLVSRNGGALKRLAESDSKDEANNDSFTKETQKDLLEDNNK